MNYSLGNMLGGAGALNADKLSLNLQFATDKSLTARKGPTPTFTRASTATFVGSNGLIQSAAINIPRFDHDPVTLACKGLLIEESRTNLVFPSDTLTTQTRTVTAVAHTLSFYGTGTVVLSGVAIATVTGTGAYPTRTTLTFTPTAGSLIMTVTGSVTQAQLEAGSFPTSYIPTTTGSVVRSTDVCSITGGNFTSFYNQSEGTAVMKFTNGDTTGFPQLFTFNQTAAQSANRIYVAGYNRFQNTEVGIVTAAINELGYFGSLTNKSGNISLAYKTNDAAYAKDGVIATTDNTVTLVTSIDRLQLQETNGCIASFRYYKKRLPNAKLQALTA